MKKFLYIFSLLICVTCLCGCESNQEDRTKIITALKNEKIISDSMEQIDTQSYNHWPLEWCKTDSYYIYKDEDSKIIAIKYEKIYSKESEHDHLVTIYYDVTINNDVNLISSEDAICDSDHSYYKYQNGEYTDNSRYEFATKKEYYATEKSALFKGKYYSLELAN